MTDGRARAGAWHRSVFWRVAGILTAVELLVVVLAVGLGAWFALDRSRELATGSIRLRLDALAEELERRVDWDRGLVGIEGVLLDDLSLRFPDPVYVIDPAGEVLVSAPEQATPSLPSLPADLADRLLAGEIAMDRGFRWAVAPVYDDVGFLAGGVVIAPIEASIQRELTPTRQALYRAAAISAVVVLALALLLAAGATWALVRPLRRVTDQVEAVGRGEYAARLPESGAQEFQRLAASVNVMAAEVAESIDRLTSTDRMRRELIANVGHDLRTPLSVLFGRLEETIRELDAGHVEEAQRHVDSAQKQSRYLIGLVEDLFELSVLDVPNPALRLEPVPVPELLRDAERSHRELFRAKGVDLQVIAAADLPIVRADGMRLLRVLGNLFGNALRHTPPGGSVEVRAHADADWLTVDITDSGPGIPEEQLPRIFERYYRGEDARTREAGAGTGLGLAIARAVAVAHGGTLEASNASGGGARFRFRLPAPSEIDAFD